MEFHLVHSLNLGEVIVEDMVPDTEVGTEVVIALVHFDTGVGFPLVAFVLGMGLFDDGSPHLDCRALD